MRMVKTLTSSATKWAGLSAVLLTIACAPSSDAPRKSIVNEGVLASDQCLNHLTDKPVDSAKLTQSGYTATDSKSAITYNLRGSNGYHEVDVISLIVSKEPHKYCRVKLYEGSPNEWNTVYKYFQVKLRQAGFQSKEVAEAPGILGALYKDDYLIYSGRWYKLSGIEARAYASIDIDLQ